MNYSSTWMTALVLSLAGGTGAVAAPAPGHPSGDLSVFSQAGFRDKLLRVIQPNDRIEMIAGANIVRNLPEMEGRGLRAGHTMQTPWSDSYWPTARGGIAARYLDRSFPNTNDFNQNYSAFMSRPPEAMVQAGMVDMLSPAEKYDLLVGDANWTLTRTFWGKGTQYQSQYGMVPSWMGSCHGWAPASLSLPEPVRSVVMRSPQGIAIRFYPNDIKALIAVLWGNGTTPSRLVGSRCNAPSAAGAMDDACFNTNPGTFHLAAVNMIGLSRRGFLMDATASAEVWNHPVFAYQYSYFNPANRAPTGDLRSAMVPVGSFGDPYAQLRSPGTAFIVGVSMQASYGVEIQPGTYEGPQRQAKTIVYNYDLELDGNGNILGGEWYTGEHPDFLWAVGGTPQGSFAGSPAANVVNSLLAASSGMR